GEVLQPPPARSRTAAQHRDHYADPGGPGGLLHSADQLCCPRRTRVVEQQLDQLARVDLYLVRGGLRHPPGGAAVPALRQDPLYPAPGGGSYIRPSVEDFRYGGHGYTRRRGDVPERHRTRMGPHHGLPPPGGDAPVPPTRTRILIRKVSGNHRNFRRITIMSRPSTCQGT